jgi:hypothetical protein
MTIQEMHYDFQFKFNQLGNQVNQYFNKAQIDWMLNRAQDMIIQKRLGENNLSRTSYEQIQKRTEDLKDLHVRYPEQPFITPIHHDEEHIYEVDLDNLKHPYLYYLRAMSTQSDGKCEYKNAKVIIVQSDDMSFSLDDPFMQSNETEILGNFGRSSDSQGSSLYLFPRTDLTLSSFKIEYLKQPKRMYEGSYEYIDGTSGEAVHCELSAHMHPQIVDQAVELAARIMTDPNAYQFATQGLLQQE